METLVKLKTQFKSDLEAAIKAIAAKKEELARLETRREQLLGAVYAMEKSIEETNAAVEKAKVVSDEG
jgi:predicted nuclease with TOPRIM domain